MKKVGFEREVCVQRKNGGAGFSNKAKQESGAARDIFEKNESTSAKSPTQQSQMRACRERTRVG
eukprot:scaffold5392_cov107-Cylindrotheca_fusiformis.AAC.10